MEGCVAEIRRYGERKEEVEKVEEGRLIVSRLLFRPVDEERKRVRESPPPPHPSFLDHRGDKTVNQRDTSQLSEPAGVGSGTLPPPLQQVTDAHKSADGWTLTD